MFNLYFKNIMSEHMARVVNLFSKEHVDFAIKKKIKKLGKVCVFPKIMSA